MAYGHAERTPAAIRLLEAETRDLLDGLAQLDPEQARWLHKVNDSSEGIPAGAGAGASCG